MVCPCTLTSDSRCADSNIDLRTVVCVTAAPPTAAQGASGDGTRTDSADALVTTGPLAAIVAVLVICAVGAAVVCQRRKRRADNAADYNKGAVTNNAMFVPAAPSSVGGAAADNSALRPAPAPAVHGMPGPTMILMPGPEPAQYLVPVAVAGAQANAAEDHVHHQYLYSWLGLDVDRGQPFPPGFC